MILIGGVSRCASVLVVRSVDDGAGVAVRVHDRVVSLAQERTVVGVGGSAVGPMLFVVGVAPAGGPVAAGGVLAVTVTDV